MEKVEFEKIQKITSDLIRSCEGQNLEAFVIICNEDGLLFSATNANGKGENTTSSRSSVLINSTGELVS